MEPCTDRIEVVKLTVGPFQENTYLVACPKTRQAVVIDPGAEPDRILESIEERSLEPIRILLTHAHLDHIGAVAAVQSRYGIPVALHPKDRPLVEMASHSAMLYGLPAPEPFEIDEDLQPGEHVTVGNLLLEILFTPGHAPGHVAFFARENRVVFSGDCLFAGSIGRTDLPFCDHETLIRSIREELLPLGDDVVVYSGHMENTTIGKERTTNPFLVHP